MPAALPDRPKKKKKRKKTKTTVSEGTIKVAFSTLTGILTKIEASHNIS